MQAAIKRAGQLSRSPSFAPVPGRGGGSESGPGVIACYDARITDELADGAYRLSDGAAASQAVSCLLRPRTGDRVVVVKCADGDVYIFAILARDAKHAAEIGVPRAAELTVSAPQLTLRATETMRVESLRDIEVTAVTGDVSLTARNLLTTVADAVVENMREYIGKAATWSLAARSFLRLHSRQAFVTAEEDMKVDAERISLG